jgi:glucose-6-phosphate isomerase
VKLTVPEPFRSAVNRRIEALTAANAARRVAGHDASFWGGDTERARSVANRLGWTDIASRMRERIPETTALAEAVRAEGYTDAVLLGMGGSSLAPEVLRQSIAPRDGYLRMHVLDTTDPATIAGVVSQIDVARTLFFVSSKSGTTIEALSLFAYFHALVAETKRERAGENFVAVTDEATPLQTLAARHGFRKVFTNPGDIGGRYSALSYFGLAPAAVCGVDVATLVDRAIAEEQAIRRDGSEAMLLGALLGELALAGRDKATFIIASEIASFGLWAEQLVAESTGKLGKGILPVAGEPYGSPEHYGEDRFFVHLRSEAGANGEGDAVAGALGAAGTPIATIDLDDAYDLGREFVRWEFAVAVAGQVLGINPFDEPNVQESKDNTARVLHEFEEQHVLDAMTAGGPGLLALTPSGTVQGPLPYAVAELLAGAPDDGYIAITAYLEPTTQAEAVFADMRALMRNATRRPATLGYGPRFLHSTGQLHKGGPPQGVFLQVTANDPADLAIPGRPFTFGQLKRAQAIGDFESLASHGRPVLRVHLGDDIEGGLSLLLEAVRTASIHSNESGG